MQRIELRLSLNANENNKVRSLTHTMQTFQAPHRVLMGPGPSDVSPRVLKALGQTTIGHLDPAFVGLMDEIKALLQYVFKTENRLTIPVSAPGSAGMETCFMNMIDPNDHVLICINGVFGGRMKDVAERYGATVHTIETDWGRGICPEQVEEALKTHPNIKAVGIVQAETSTGEHQPLEEISALVRNHGALLVVDAVTSLGGINVPIDELGIDACYSGTQKCLSCPPGLAPVTFSDKAVDVIGSRKSKVTSWYLDLTMLRNYWGSDRVYHHTAPINMTYALRESLQIILEEGLQNRIARHEKNHRMLRAGLEAMGLSFIPEHSLTTLNAVHVPEGVDDAAVRSRLLQDYGIEIGAGLGPFKGKAWRIGLMGTSSTQRNVTLIISALEAIMSDLGHSVPAGAGLAAAQAAVGEASLV